MMFVYGNTTKMWRSLGSHFHSRGRPSGQDDFVPAKTPAPANPQRMFLDIRTIRAAIKTR
jgi:hypothetical protein